MTIKVKKTTFLLNNRGILSGSEKMCCLIVTGTNTAERNNRSESRVSPPHTENQLPPESTICRTMTIGHSSSQTVINTTATKSPCKSELYSRNNQNSKATESCRPEIKSIEKNNNSSAAAFHTSHFSSVSDKMNKSIQNSDKMICPSRFFGLFSGSLAKRSERSEHFSYDSSSISTIPSRTKVNHLPSRYWAFEMILALLIILSAFSTSSRVLCVPLGHQNAGNDEAAPSITDSNRRSEGAVIMSNARLLELEQKSHPLEDIQDKGQIYLPSLLKNDRVKAAAAALATPVDYPFGGPGTGRNVDEGLDEDEQKSSRHPFTSYTIDRWQTSAAGSNPTAKNRMPIQKLPPLDLNLIRSPAVEGKEDDDFDDDNASDAPLSESELGLKSDVPGDINDDSANEGQPEWETVLDPHLYVLTEWNTQPYQEQFPLLQQQRKRRNSGTGPSLSIVNPLDVLRQRLLLEIARRRMRQSHNQIIANEEILRKIGRRRR